MLFIPLVLRMNLSGSPMFIYLCSIEGRSYGKHFGKRGRFFLSGGTAIKDQLMCMKRNSTAEDWVTDSVISYDSLKSVLTQCITLLFAKGKPIIPFLVVE